MAIEVSIKTITPKIAEKLLAANTHNRTVRRVHLEQLTGAMARGEWKVNADTIRIDRNGILLDGQHRLMACVKSGASFKTLVAEGLEPDTFDTIDKGSRRTVGDTLKVSGEINALQLAAALNSLGNLQLGKPVDFGAKMTDKQIEQVLADNPDIRQSVKMYQGSRIRNMKLMRGGMACAMHYLFAQKSREDADLLYLHLGEGGVYPSNHPANILRERLMLNRVSTARMSSDVIVILLIKVWNSMRTGKPMQQLKVAPGESRPAIK